jgi:hypothetical protein
MIGIAAGLPEVGGIRQRGSSAEDPAFRPDDWLISPFARDPSRPLDGAQKFSDTCQQVAG